MKNTNNDITSYYTSLSFSKHTSRPHFYTSFVATLDGKIYVEKPGYWPIGSKTDYEVFTTLRAYADIIIDGKNTALRFARHTIDTMHSEHFLKLRKQFGKTEPINYAVISSHPDENLVHAVENTHGFKPFLLTSKHADPLLFHDYFVGEQVFTDRTNIDELASFLHKEGYKNVFVDGGPTLLASFVEAQMLDELFLTIAPRIFGSEEGRTLTMVEGRLIDPKLSRFHLEKVMQENSELFLHYKV